MRILFLETHPMWIFGLPNGFKDLGHHIKLADPNNEPLLKEALKEFQPHLIFSMGWTPANDTPEKQERIGNYTQAFGIPHVYWATEDPGYTEVFSLPYLERAKPDFVFTICTQKVGVYENSGIGAAHLDFGYHPSVHYPTHPHRQYTSTAALVANGYPQLYEKDPAHQRFTSLKTLVEPFLDEKIETNFYGRYWDQMKKLFGKNVPANWIKGYLPYPEANKVYSSVKIVIGVQNKMTQVTQRTYEILASGGFLLTTDTPEVRRLFVPGKDLLVSSSREETLQLLRYYLDRPDERRKICEHGLETVKKHSYTIRAKKALETLCTRKVIPRHIL
ncbi:CgeB family protein [Aneurinibacillus tyrosinisolvens]|uniref:CgeB family protein n=1 Tax=Aneurinibacillus tyrosinisolvens TaxID=1443435 RepID=UPI00063F2415|nr:glycosyltransferase [Aneurinibacillus tyrosinisolvens]